MALDIMCIVCGQKVRKGGARTAHMERHAREGLVQRHGYTEHWWLTDKPNPYQEQKDAAIKEWEATQALEAKAAAAKMEGPFFVFAWPEGAALGGMNDLRISTNTREQAEEASALLMEDGLVTSIYNVGGMVKYHKEVAESQQANSASWVKSGEPANL
jgi:hypothetical protein